MTAIDEITYRTPDALFNGQAVINVIQSCVPAVKNAWDVPNTDINALLVAIRIASYGHDMEVASTCPSCKHEEDYTVDMRVLLDHIHCPDYDKKLKYGDLQITFKPVNYAQQNETGMMQFEQQKILSMIPDSSLSEDEKMTRLSEALKHITNLTITVVTNSIAAIETPGAAVVDSEQIEEFLRNQKEEADAVLFSRKSKIMKYMICNSNIEYAEEQIDTTENDLEKNVWQQTKMIWSETKEEVDDMIFMYGEGGQPHTCSCQKYSKGGLAYGNSHDKGGMPMTVKSTGQKIEIEGGEGVVNKRTMQSAKEVNLNGKKMTPCEAVSKLNEMGGGVKFKCPDVKEIISKDGNF
jgi:hypothetical protein